MWGAVVSCVVLRLCCLCSGIVVSLEVGCSSPSCVVCPDSGGVEVSRVVMTKDWTKDAPRLLSVGGFKGC